jgi:uncharacterized membrane protein YkgB
MFYIYMIQYYLCLGTYVSYHNQTLSLFILMSLILLLLLYLSNAYSIIPYHSNRLLPLVVADPASFFYDTKLNKKIIFN